MNRYESTIPRTAIGIAAIALSALTLALAVVLPAHLIAQRHDAGTLAASSTPAIAAAREVTITPAQINVVADCDHAQGASQT